MVHGWRILGVFNEQLSAFRDELTKTETIQEIQQAVPHWVLKENNFDHFKRNEARCSGEKGKW